MTNEIMAITGGLVLAAFVIFPFGVTTTSGTRFAPREPFSWANWREEARVSLWTINPVVICKDVWQGYEDFTGAFLRMLGLVIVLAVLCTAAALVGWGVLSCLLW